MQVAVFSTHTYDRRFFDEANAARGHDLRYFEARLVPATAGLAAGSPAVCAFVNDQLNAAALETLAAGGTRLVALRSAGFNHVDLPAAKALGLTVSRVPAYSPHAVAEHAAAIARMKPGVMIVNTSRGALVDTPALIAGLKSGQVGFLGLDVYEEEENLFFQDRSADVIQDDVFARLLTFPNVLVTAHQAFFTREALTAIAETTLGNVTAFAAGRASGNEI